jgi:type II pantothenate kinase
MLAGIDLGASLYKVALARTPSLADLELARFPPSGRDDMLAFVRARAPTRVVATGGPAAEVAAAIAAPGRVVSEFEAWARGAPRLAARAGAPLAEPYLLVSLGTGTSILLVADGHATRIAGTALGGGTLVGLGALLLGVERFERLAELAARGSRRDVDLLLGDVYPDMSVPEFTAAHFGKLRSRRPEDVAHALFGLVAENVALMCAAHAAARGVTCVVYGGSPLHDAPALAGVLASMTGYFGLRVVVLPDGGYCGAVGCLATAFDDGPVTRRPGARRGRA